MNCEQAQNLFDAYLDGELSLALETELHAHRLNCPSCRQELALMEVAGHVIRSGSGAEPSLGGDFTERLLACIEPSQPAVRYHRKWVFRLGTGLAAAACLTLAVMQMRGPTPKVAPFKTDSGRVSSEPVTVGLDGSGRTRPGSGVADADVAGNGEPQRTPAAADELEQAVQALKRTIENAVRGTQESSESLVHFGQTTVLQMIDALQPADSPEPDALQEPPSGDETDQRAEPVEDI